MIETRIESGPDTTVFFTDEGSEETRSRGLLNIELPVGCFLIRRWKNHKPRLVVDRDFYIVWTSEELNISCVRRRPKHP